MRYRILNQTKPRGTRRCGDADRFGFLRAAARRFGRRFATLGSAALFASGCSWFGGDAKEKMAQLTEFTPTAKAAIAWRASAGKRSDAGFVPIVVQDTVFAASNDGQVTAFQASGGKQLWRNDVKQKLSSGVGHGSDAIFVGTRKGEVIALGVNGKEIWRSQLPSEILAQPQASEDVVVARTGDGRVVGLEKTSGKRKWTQQRTNPALILRNLGAVTMAQDAAFAGFPGGKLLALKLDNGNVIWEGTVATPRGATELERIADVVAAPVIDEQRVCAVAYQGRLSCFDPAKGTLDWYREVSSAVGLAQNQRSIYTVDDRSQVLAFSKATGSSLWKQDKFSGRKLSGPAVYSNYVVVGDVEGYVHILAAEDGKLAARVATDGSPISAPPAVTANGVVVQTTKANLFAVAIR